MNRSQLLPFLERLKGGVVLADGAMGTLLHQGGAPFDACFDALNLTAPERVQAVHSAYIAAGAELIETNTFGANRFKLAQHNRAAEVAAI
ncbi:MAG: homocysteine S-methyltransferase family protein, partial [Aggregatilineales bacterium]